MKGEVSFHCTGQSALGELLNLPAVSQGRGKSWMLGSPRAVAQVVQAAAGPHLRNEDSVAGERLLVRERAGGVPGPPPWEQRKAGGFYHLPALGRAGRCPGVSSPTANAAVAFHLSFLTTSSSPLPRHPLRPAWSWLNLGRGQRAEDSQHQAPPAPLLWEDLTSPGPHRAARARREVPGRRWARAPLPVLAGELGGWLGSGRQGGSSQSVGQGQALEHGAALLPGAWQSLPAWGVAALAPASCSGGTDTRGGGWGECLSHVCPAKGHSSPLGLAGSRDSNPGHQPRQTLPSLPFPSHHRRPGALRYENPGARGSHRHHNPPPPRQPGDQALLPQWHDVPDRNHQEHGLVSTEGDGGVEAHAAGQDTQPSRPRAGEPGPVSSLVARATLPSHGLFLPTLWQGPQWLC